MPAGNLSAELDGPHAKFTIEYPPRPEELHPDEEWYDHLMVERYHGMKKDENKLSPTYGQMIEDWQPINTGNHKFVRSDTVHHMRWPVPDPSDPEGVEPPPPGPHKYRALVYRIYEKPRSGVRMLSTDGIFSNHVTV